MLKLSKKVDYGLIALMHLARNGECTSWSAREISETYDIPGGLLAKVLQKLGRADLVSSQHGTKGGYSLSRPAESIRALEVVEAIEGPVSLAQCFSDEGECVQFEKCNLKSPLQQLNDIVIRILSRVTLAQLAQEEVNTLEMVASESFGGNQKGPRSDLLPLIR
jgi:Rrf2 family protein